MPDEAATWLLAGKPWELAGRPWVLATVELLDPPPILTMTFGLGEADQVAPPVHFFAGPGAVPEAAVDVGVDRAAEVDAAAEEVTAVEAEGEAVAEADAGTGADWDGDEGAGWLSAGTAAPA